MADTTLSPTNLEQIEVGASEDTWGTKINQNTADINSWFQGSAGSPLLKVANGGTGAATLTGLVAGTGTSAMVARTLTGTANELTVTNGTGVSGNPTISLPSALTFTGKTVTGGTYSAPTLSGNAQFTGVPYGGATDPVNTNTPGWSFSSSGILNMAATTQVMFLNRLTSDGGVINFYRQNVGVGSISVTGSATAYNTSSDYRLKENVAPMTGALARLLALSPCRFNFLATPGVTVDGFIAHEVAAVVPEAITGAKDAVDPETGAPIYQGIDQSKLVPLLTAALQEAVARIVALEAAHG